MFTEYFSSEQQISHCTGSLITPTYVLTAAHCTEYIQQRHWYRDVEDINDECVKETQKGHTYISKHEARGGHVNWKLEIKCRYIEFEFPGKKGTLKNLEIVMVNPKARIWVGRDNVRKKKLNDETSTVKRVIRHAHSYKGGGVYGSYGGYDIALLELDTKINLSQFACIPSPSFKDQNIEADIAGYGKYLRDGGETCETNQFGRSKHHYCKVGGMCIMDRKPPQSPKCKDFLASVGKNWSENGKYDEAMVKDKDLFYYCYPDTNPEDESFGWCETQGTFYDRKSRDHYSLSWGYCSSDCYLEKNGKLNGQILRHKSDVHVGVSWKFYLTLELEMIIKVQILFYCSKIYVHQIQKKWFLAILESTTFLGFGCILQYDAYVK